MDGIWKVGLAKLDGAGREYGKGGSVRWTGRVCGYSGEFQGFSFLVKGIIVIMSTGVFNFRSCRCKLYWCAVIVS